MATFDYDQLTGELKQVKENTSVADRVTGLMSTNSPLMKQARTTGNQQANRRGLLSSTMGIQAAESEAYRAAIPIASQEAAQSNQRVMQTRDITNQRKLMEMELGSRERLQQAEQAAQKERLGMQISSQEKIALQDLQAAEARLNQQLTAQNLQQNRQIISNEQQNTLDRVSQERQNSLTTIANFEQSYATMVANIMNNPDIPASERQRYLDHASNVRDSNIRMVEQMYGFQLNWSGGASAPTQQQSTPQQPTTPPASAIPADQVNNFNIFNSAREAGMNAQQVAQSYGMTVDEVNTWLNERGLSL